MPKRILVIDDELRMRRILQLLLEENHFLVKTAGDGVEGMVAWKEFNPHVVLTDIKMPKADGLEILAFKQKNHLKAPLIILTAFGTIEKAVFAIKQGAYDYLTKPFKNDEVIKVVRSAVLKIDGPSGSEAENHNIIGSSEAVKDILDDIAIVSKTRTSVLISGDSGTGKELVARSIHRLSDRRQKQMVKVNCSAIPSELLESELFGHIKGSFTGAVSNRIGSFQKADKGILFLDEIGDLPIGLQPKLLHAVEDKTVTAVGASKSQHVDIKIIAATNKDLTAMIDANTFRKDLYFRLNTFNIHLPPLRNRPEDIDELVQSFIQRFSTEFEKSVQGISRQALDWLKEYPWPGNIRELKNVVERAVLKTQAHEIDVVDFPKDFNSNALDEVPTGLDLEAKEKQLIIRALEKTGGNQVQAAKLLNISRNTLRYRSKKYLE